MGCGGSSQSVSNRPGAGKLLIWGDYFSPETRTILGLLMMSDIGFDIEIVDQFKGDHKTPAYMTVNPTGQLPTITEGDYLVLGGYSVFLQYLSANHKLIKDKFYPD